MIKKLLSEIFKNKPVVDTGNKNQTEKWEDLKVYRLLPPEEIPKTFKIFARLIAERLSNKGFQIKESKTVKKIYRITNDLEQSITFDNASRWAKNKKEFRIVLSIKPLDSKTQESPFYIYEPYQIFKNFKLYYEINQHYLLLADHLSEKINNTLLPFFNKFSSFESIVKNHKEFYTLYKLDNKIIRSREVTELILQAALVTRNQKVFNEFYSSDCIHAHSQFKNNPNWNAINKETMSELFKDDNKFNLFKKDIDDRKEQYLEFLKTKK